ncbi:Hypothetical protein PHPALM_1241 [Phytophthora palmivora]|uniref:Uncharacterized protein n=1 Tax=Phytophthora palmivora TaxID=4796 RepID=A0A2P4YSV2_9STRA|nr:Hypothetical protein PHPALM_1241 [Phytophthora palmivora]
MNQDALSSRQRESPLTRRNRDVPSPTTNCLEVQWRFLQHKNPKPPQFSSSSRKPLLIDPLNSQFFHNNNANFSSKQFDRTHAQSRGSPSRLFHMFEMQEVETEEPNASNAAQNTTQQEKSLPESPRASRTLNDLMGETQRQAMLDRILADLEDDIHVCLHLRPRRADHEGGAKTSQRARSHKPLIVQKALHNDPGCDQNNDRKRRQHRKLQQFNQENEGPRIFWQQTTGARSAVDVPERLLTSSPSPPRRRSAHIVLGRRSNTRRKLLSPSVDRQRNKESMTLDATNTQQIPQTISGTKTSSSAMSSRRRKRLNGHVSTATGNETGTMSPPKAHYGAWYVPQSEWWTMHQIEQQNITDKFPSVTAGDEIESHCHRRSTTSSQRQHKPPLPPAALSPRLNDNIQSTKPVNEINRTPSITSRTGTTQPATLELQGAGIPQSYIGREYRAYIISTGSTMPQYLQ